MAKKKKAAAKPAKKAASKKAKSAAKKPAAKSAAAKKKAPKKKTGGKKTGGKKIKKAPRRSRAPMASSCPSVGDRIKIRGKWATVTAVVNCTVNAEWDEGQSFEFDCC